MGSLTPDAGLFPATKFSAPRQAADTIDRPALLARLEQLIEGHSLTLLSATAGAGKTTLLSQWAATTDRPAAWVRLDTADDDLETFATALHDALAGVGGARRLGHVLGEQLDPTRLATAVVNDLVDLADLVMVLDDLHVIDDHQTLAMLTAVIDHLPERVSVLAATRTEHPDLGLPLRMARGQVARLGFSDLRLSDEEVQQLVVAAGGEAEGARAIARASNGWAAAVRLAMGPTASTLDPTDPASLATMRQFIATEVLDRLPADLRDFLLRCSILSELRPEACRAVTGRDDAPMLLDHLLGHNLLLADASDAHLRLHDLLREHLAGQLAAHHPDEVPELHRRAATATPPHEAISHLIAAGHPQQAADLIAEVSLARVHAGEHTVPSAWLRMLPEKVRARHPRLRLVTALSDVRAGRMDVAVAALPDVVEELHDDPDAATRALGEAAQLEATLGVGDFSTAQRLAAQLGDQHDAPPRVQAYALVGRTWLAYYGLDWEGVATALEQQFELLRQHLDPAVASLIALGINPELLPGDHGPEWLVGQTRWLTDSGLVPSESPGGTGLRSVLAGDAFRRGDFDSARREVAAARRLSRSFGGLAWIDPSLDRLELALAAAVGDHATTDRVVEQIEAAMPTSPTRQQDGYATAFALATSLAERGRHQEVPAAVARLAPKGHVPPFAEVTRAILGSRAARWAGDVAAAEEQLRGVLELQDRARGWLMSGHAGLELANLLLANGRQAEALDLAAPTLRHLASQGSVGWLLQDRPTNVAVLQAAEAAGMERVLCRQALALANEGMQARPAEIPGTDERITAREVEVLREVAAGRSNRDVAAALFISERTVTTHMTSLLRKLDASSRTEAVARAREYGILV